MLNIQIKSFGAYIPAHKVSSAELGEKHNLPAEWIEKHAGVEERPYFLTENIIQAGTQAARQAIKNAALELSDIDCLISASASKMRPIPCNASFYKRELNATHSMMCFDIDSTCLSFVNALDVAACMIHSGKARHILIISSEQPSATLNWEQKESASLFGDCAVAAVVSQTPKGGSSKIILSLFDTFSDGLPFATIEGGLLERPAWNYSENTHQKYLFDMNGRSIYKTATKTLPKMVQEALKRAGMSIQDIQMVIPHQASLLSMKLMQSKLGIAPGKMMYIIQHQGNNVAASIPLALKAAVDEGKVKRGDKIMLLGTSAGLSIGVMILEY